MRDKVRERKEVSRVHYVTCKIDKLKTSTERRK